MKMIELVAPCHFGMEAVLKREILDLGYEISQVEDGRVTFLGDLEAVAYANVFLRTTERILIKVGKIHAETFDELFEGTKALPWEDFIPEDGKFWVAKANSVKSALFSPSDIQDHEESDRRTTQKCLWNLLVSGGRSKFPDPCRFYEGCGNYWNRYFRCFSS